MPSTEGVKMLAISSSSSCWGLTDDGSLRVSRDAGNTWQAVEPGIATTSMCLDAYGANIIVSGGNDVVVYSADNGTTWKSITLPAFGLANAVVVGRGENTIFYAQNLQGKVVSFTSSGETVKEYPAPFNGAFQTFAVSPNGTLVMGTENKGIFRWSAADLFWSFSLLPITQPVVALFANHSDTVIASLESGMIIWSDDNAKTFTVADTSLRPLKTFDFTELHSGSIVAVGTNGSIAVDVQHNGSWQSVMVRSRALITAISKVGADALVVGDEHGALLRYANNTWTALESPTQGFINSIASIGGGPMILCSRQQGSGSGLYRSDDGGETWTGISPPVLAGLPSFEVVKAGSESHFYGIVQGMLYRTTNVGATWSKMPLVVNNTELTVGKMLSVVGANELWCTAYADNDLYHTTDGGISWARISHSGFGKPAFVVSTPTGSICTGTSVSFNVSTDNGATWSRTPETATPDDAAGASENGDMAVYSQRTLFIRRASDTRWYAFQVPVQDLPQRLVASKAVCWLDNETVVIPAGYGGLLRARLRTISSVSANTSHATNLIIRGMHGSGYVHGNRAFDTNTTVAIYNVNGQHLANATVCYEGDRPVLTLNQVLPLGLYSVIDTSSTEITNTSRAQPIAGYILIW